MAHKAAVKIKYIDTPVTLDVNIPLVFRKQLPWSMPQSQEAEVDLESRFKEYMVNYCEVGHSLSAAQSPPLYNGHRGSWLPL